MSPSTETGQAIDSSSETETSTLDMKDYLIVLSSNQGIYSTSKSIHCIDIQTFEIGCSLCLIALRCNLTHFLNIVGDTIGNSGNTFIQHLARHVQEIAHKSDIDSMLLKVSISIRF